MLPNYVNSWEFSCTYTPPCNHTQFTPTIQCTCVHKCSILILLALAANTMSVCTVIFAYSLPLCTNHFHQVPTDVAAVLVLCSSQFTLHLIFSLNLTPRSPLLAVITGSALFPPITTLLQLLIVGPSCCSS